MVKVPVWNTTPNEADHIESPSRYGTPLVIYMTFMQIIKKLILVANVDFAEVLKCFILLMKRLSQGLWKGEAPEYPQNIFEAITDNPQYISCLQSPSSEQTFANLSWFHEYVMTLQDSERRADIFERVVQYLCDETRHERSDDTQAACIFFATRVRSINFRLLFKKFIVTIQLLRKDLKRSVTEESSINDPVFSRIIETYFPVIMPKAYDGKYNNPSWKSSQDTARGLVEDVLVADIKSARRTIKSISRILGQIKMRNTKDAAPDFSFRKSIWDKLYTMVKGPDAVASVVRIISNAAHMDRLKTSVFTDQWDFPDGDKVLYQVNEAIGTFHTGFIESISSFAEYSNSNNALDVLQKPGVAKSVTLLLLSPVQDLHGAGKVLVGLAFDVDGRMDCFRAMLTNIPIETLDAMLEFLEIFYDYAAALPEASSISAALVRCFADILEVLCASPDGLLLNQYFLRPKDETGPASKMHKFWKLLTKSLTVIYNRASMWARHIDTPDMVLWMRDALILARDSLKQWRVIENASNTLVTASKPVKQGQLSPVGKQMIEALQSFLPELIRWLRLTDEELLHQSFSLLQSLFDLMKESHVRPSDIALEKLTKYLEGALTSDESKREQKTRLDRARLLQLSEVLSHFRGDNKESDDEIVILSHTVLPKKKQKIVAEKPKEKTIAEPRTYIQGKAQTAKSSTQLKLSYPSTSRPSSSKFFSDKDQAKLDSAISFPSFKRSDLPSVPSAGSSKMVVDTRRPLKKAEPKNEAIRPQPGQQQESDSSDSDSEESDDEVGTEAFIQPLKDKSPKKPKVIERRQIKTLDIPLKVNPMEERLAQNRRAHYNALRMRPDISSLHRTMLSWDYSHEGPVPPGKPLQANSIPDRFESYDHYFHIFQPLLLMECWAQLQQSKEEKQDSYSFKVDSRAFVDNWLDINISISESVKKDWYLADTDVVLLRHLQHDKCIMALVKSYQTLPIGITATVRCYTATKNDPGLHVATMWQISKIFRYSLILRPWKINLSNHFVA